MENEEVQAIFIIVVSETHHEEYSRRRHEEATVFVSEGLVGLWLSRYRVHPFLLRVFGLKLWSYFILNGKKAGKRKSKNQHEGNVHSKQYLNDIFKKPPEKTTCHSQMNIKYVSKKFLDRQQIKQENKYEHYILYLLFLPVNQIPVVCQDCSPSFPEF